MRGRAMHRCVFAVLATLLILCCPVVYVLAEDNTSTAITEDMENQNGNNETIPRYEPERSVYFGYRWVSQEDSLKAAEYQYPHSSVTFGVDALAISLPHRYHLNGEFLNKKDYYGDLGYAYRDLILFRDIFVGLRHNPDHFNYQFPDVPPSIRYDDRNHGDGYFIDYYNNQFSLRLKAPDYPFHVFWQNRNVVRDGSIEERFILGDYSGLTKTSQTREIDWKSNATTIGANSHLGPLELEYTYDFSKFDPGSNNILHDYYPPSFIFGRPADVYPHSVVPETESSSNHLKLHSSYTGQIVASAALSNLYQKNNYSNAESTTWRGVFDFRWLPDPVIGLFFKYRHKELDNDNPSQVTLAGLATTNTYSVRRSLSYKKDVFSLSARYKPFTKFTFLTSYEFEHLERKDVDEWAVLPDNSDVHHINLTVHAKPVNKLKLKAVYDYRYYDDPAYNTVPDYSNEIRLVTTYIPVPWLTVYADYKLTLTQREDLRYLNAVPSVLVEGGERDGRTDRFLASFSFLFTPKTTLTASWAYNRWKIEQDLAYAKSPGQPYVDTGVPYTDESNTFSLALQYLPREDITVTADVSQTISEGEWLTGNVVVEPGSLSAFSLINVAETLLTLELRKRFLEDWEAGLKFYADIYDDRAGDFQDGKFYATTLSLKRYF